MKKINDFHDPLMPTLLMSIHSEYVNQILQGTKIIEYRKRFFQDGFQAFVYTTGPHGGIELFMKCAPAIRSNAETLAKIGQQIQHDDYDEIYDYFIPKDDGYEIPILETCALEKISLKKLREILPTIVVPQAYLFLDAPEKKPLLNYLKDQIVLEHKTNKWKQHFANIANLAKNSADISLF